MAFLNITNRAGSSLSAGIDNVQTSFDVASGQGALFPASNFIITIEDERILVETRTTDTFSPCTRGYDGTTAIAHDAGKAVELRIIAKHITELQDFANTKGQASGLASLDASSLVVQNPANATATPTASKISIADANGKLFGWVTASINAQTGTTYTLVLSDAFKIITFGNAAAITVTIPTNASVAFPIGTQIDCIQILAGKVTFSGTGVTINSKGGNKSIAAQWVGVTLVKMGTDTWNLFGDLVA